MIESGEGLVRPRPVLQQCQKRIASLPWRFLALGESCCGATWEPARRLVDKGPGVSRTGLDGYSSLNPSPRVVGTVEGPCTHDGPEKPGTRHRTYES
jgi:hypothetical protein